MTFKQLFSRPGVSSDAISFRNALANHRFGLLGLREAIKKLPVPDRGTGFLSGCRRAGSSTIKVPGLLKREVGNILPAWVDVIRRDHRTRALEGVLLKSKMTDEDFPLDPWHTSLDWNFFIEVDQQYAYLVSNSSRQHNSEKFGRRVRNIIECEWESAFVPLWAAPQEDCRVWMVGRWIYDCGHPENNRHRTEIHPPKAIATFRDEAALLPGNSAATPATRGAVYMGKRGGYFDQNINDRFVFDLYLPPKPHPAALPRTSVTPMTGSLPAQPSFEPFPKHDPKLLRVRISLVGGRRLDEYGAIVFGGWSDPDGSASKGVKRVRVTIDRINRTKPIATEKPSAIPPNTQFRTWHLHVCINARWHALLLSSPKNKVDVSTDLFLPSDGKIQITAFGIEKRNIFGFLGEETGLDPTFASQTKTSTQREAALKEIAKAFRSGIFKHGPPLSDGNVSLGLFSKAHSAGERGKFKVDSASVPGNFKSGQNHNNYVLEYRIEDF